MSDIVIRARDLKKVYRLYNSPRHRFLDMFGLLRANSGAFTEHAALAGIDLEIRKGEKVAFIGRNGAGKSTLLKLLTGVIEPTSGFLEVKGRAHALLQIGSGFHPDFTGRENVYAYLAQLGVTGKEADRRYQEIVEFSELEEYIRQPVKTYSSGMAVRLMFATSTAITPDLLVLDEVLGVGDAYFARKSYERIKDLCEGSGTTLLLVTHDIFSAAQLCNRLIWIDSGKVVMDADAPPVLKAYDDSIRAQEERRLRLRQQVQLRANSELATTNVLLEIRTAANRPQPCPVYFSKLQMICDGVAIPAPLGETAFEAAADSQLIREANAWGEPVELDGRSTRPMLNYGGPFHKVAAAFAVPSVALRPGSSIEIEVEWWAEQQCDLEAVAFVDGAAYELGAFVTPAGEWSQRHLAWTRESKPSADLKLHSTGDIGAGDITITRIEMVDATGVPCRVIQHGATVSIRLEYSIARPMLRENAQVFLVVSRDNTARICKFFTSALTFDWAAAQQGVVSMRLPKMMLSAGTYSVAAEIAAEGYLEQGSGQYFSVDPQVYHVLSHAFEFTVIDSGWIGDYTVFEGDGEWSLEPK